MTKKILHRCNDIPSIQRALELYDGLECDVRLSTTGELYLSHDATSEATVSLALLLSLASGTGKTLALNVKEHGLSSALNELRQALCCTDYFLFDVPGVELPHYHRLGLRVFGRFSAYEIQQPLNNGGILIDTFHRGQQRDIFLRAGLNPLLPDVSSGSRIALISNGCHGRHDEPNMQSPAISYLIGKEHEL